MCGIAGVYSRERDAVNDSGCVQRMLDAIEHRGPDGEGIVEERGAVLGHRRLAIIDPSDRGAQPMSDWTGRFVITYNGEVYNYVELRTELERLGARFASSCDTEVLVNAFADVGAGLPPAAERPVRVRDLRPGERGALLCARPAGDQAVRLRRRRAPLRLRVRAEGPARGGTRRAQARPRRGVLVHRARARRPAHEPVCGDPEPGARPSAPGDPNGREPDGLVVSVRQRGRGRRRPGRAGRRASVGRGEAEPAQRRGRGRVPLRRARLERRAGAGRRPHGRRRGGPHRRIRRRGRPGRAAVRARGGRHARCPPPRGRDRAGRPAAPVRPPDLAPRRADRRPGCLPAADGLGPRRPGGPEGRPGRTGRRRALRGLPASPGRVPGEQAEVRADRPHGGGRAGPPAAGARARAPRSPDRFARARCRPEPRVPRAGRPGAPRRRTKLDAPHARPGRAPDPRPDVVPPSPPGGGGPGQHGGVDRVAGAPARPPAGRAHHLAAARAALLGAGEQAAPAQRGGVPPSRIRRGPHRQERFCDSAGPLAAASRSQRARRPRHRLAPGSQRTVVARDRRRERGLLPGLPGGQPLLHHQQAVDRAGRPGLARQLESGTAEGLGRGLGAGPSRVEAVAA